MSLRVGSSWFRCQAVLQRGALPAWRLVCTAASVLEPLQHRYLQHIAKKLFWPGKGQDFPGTFGVAYENAKVKDDPAYISSIVNKTPLFTRPVALLTPRSACGRVFDRR